MKVADGSKTDEEIEELARDPEKAQEVIMTQMQGRDGVHTKLKVTVQDIEAKHKEILQLERNVNELFELFQELSTLIQAQGD